LHGKKQTEDGIRYWKKTGLFLWKSYDFPYICFQNLSETILFSARENAEEDTDKTYIL
jgi:hypothetical protein